MPLRESKGNMYPFVTHTWNPIKGRCSHDCEYCYMKRFPLKELRLDEKDLQTDLGSGHFIFVGSSTDMWAEGIDENWIYEVLRRCEEFPENTYLFQSKNPSGFITDSFIKSVFATTIETNRRYECMGTAPATDMRAAKMSRLSANRFRTMITIEPILDFDLDDLIKLIQFACPEWVNIGADSQGHHLPEPSAEKVKALIEQLSLFTTVKIKSNLKRITGGQYAKRNESP